jgi:hypothetical protein
MQTMISRPDYHSYRYHLGLYKLHEATFDEKLLKILDFC